MRRIGFVLTPGFQVMSFAALPVFEYTNKEMGEPIYDPHLLSETGGLIVVAPSVGCGPARIAHSALLPSASGWLLCTEGGHRPGTWLSTLLHCTAVAHHNRLT